MGETQEAGTAGRGVEGEEAAVPRACRACGQRGSLFPPEPQVWTECSLACVSHLHISGLEKPQAQTGEAICPQRPSRAVVHPPSLLFSVEGADGGPARGQARPEATVPRPGAARQAGHPRQAAWVSSCHPGEAGGDGQGTVDRPVRLAPRLPIPASGLRGHSTRKRRPGRSSA